MYSTFNAFGPIHGLNTRCNCCYCGKSIPATEAYTDSIGRTLCESCIASSHITYVYEMAIYELAWYLDQLKIPYKEIEPLYDGYAIRFSWCSGDVACHYGTYGSNIGRLESYGFSKDNGDVSGFLTPLEAAEIVLHEWNEYNKQMRKQQG